MLLAGCQGSCKRCFISLNREALLNAGLDMGISIGTRTTLLTELSELFASSLRKKPIITRSSYTIHMFTCTIELVHGEKKASSTPSLITTAS